MDNFLPEDYKEEKAPSDYFRFEAGENRIRILGGSITGFEYFNKENKPVRSREPFESTPDIKPKGMVKKFWAFPIFNYFTKSVQIMEVTQQSIKDPILGLIGSAKWGSPFLYDICITKTGEDLETRYQVQAEPPIGEVSEEIKNAYMEKPIELEKLFTGDNPFAK